MNVKNQIEFSAMFYFRIISVRDNSPKFLGEKNNTNVGSLFSLYLEVQYIYSQV